MNADNIYAASALGALLCSAYGSLLMTVSDQRATIHQ